MARSSPRFKQAEITRALKGAKAAGFCVAQIKIAVDGTIEIEAGSDIKSDPDNAFDAWKASDAHKAKGLNRVIKRLADGRTVTYWYAWKSGPALTGEPGTPEFIASYNDAVSQKVRPPAAACCQSCRHTKRVKTFCNWLTVRDAATSR